MVIFTILLVHISLTSNGVGAHQRCGFTALTVCRLLVMHFEVWPSPRPLSMEIATPIDVGMKGLWVAGCC